MTKRPFLLNISSYSCNNRCSDYRMGLVCIVGRGIRNVDFLKLNIISILYALVLFVPVEFMLNVSNVGNLTSEQATIVNAMTIITFLVIVLGAGITIIFPTKKWFGDKKIRIWAAVLWIPYFILFLYVFTKAFPAIAGTMPTNPVISWALIGTLIIYPFYILVINFFSTK